MHFAFQVHILSSERDTVMVIIERIRMCGIYYFCCTFLFLLLTRALSRKNSAGCGGDFFVSPMHTHASGQSISLYVSGYERIKDGLILESNQMLGIQSAVIFLKV